MPRVSVGLNAVWAAEVPAVLTEHGIVAQAHIVVAGDGSVGDRLLQEAKLPFKALVRDAAKARELNARGVQTAAGDLREPRTLPAALGGVDKVFVVTPLVPDQVQMRAALITAAKTAGVKHFVMSTGIGAAPDSPVQIGRWHGENQKQVQESGMAWTFVQPGFFMQNLNDELIKFYS